MYMYMCMYIKCCAEMLLLMEFFGLSDYLIFPCGLVYSLNYYHQCFSLY